MRRRVAPAAWVLSLVLLSLASLSGCQWIFDDTGYLRDHKDDYLKEKTIPEIEIPDPVLHDKPKEAYPVPDAHLRAKVEEGSEVWQPPKPPSVIEISEQEDEDLDPEELDVKENQVSLTQDGNGYTVIMLDMEFNWAWALVGEAIEKASLELDDLDRDRAVYYVKSDIDAEGNRTKRSRTYEVKLNYTSNGVQVALQRNENTLAAKPAAELLLTAIHEQL